MGDLHFQVSTGTPSAQPDARAITPEVIGGAAQDS